MSRYDDRDFGRSNYDKEVEMYQFGNQYNDLDYNRGSEYNDEYNRDYNRHYHDGSDSKEASDEPFKHGDDHGGEGSDDGHEEMKLDIYQACGLNTMNMFGTGPFITVPFVVAAADPPGPHALIGYALAAFACMNDSLIWSELGSMWPHSGGSYVYLREMFGRHTYGRLMAFLFVWQIMVSGPMECASGFIATAQYLAYIDGNSSYWHHAGIATLMCAATVWALYREIDEVGTITLILWAFTIGAIIFTLFAGYIAFDPKYIKTPDDAFDDGGRFFVSLGVAARFAVYDFTGYYDVNFVGNEVQNPRKTIPIACITTCCVVAMVFFLVDIAIIGSLEWDPDKDGYVALVEAGGSEANYIMAIFCETTISRTFAIFFTIIVCITIFGSCFSFMIGLAQIPYTAAKDGYFYHFLSHEHEHYRGLQDYSLLFVGFISTVFCFLELEIVIQGMLTMQLLIQFMAQGFGLMYYRWFIPLDEQEEPLFKVPLFPIPNIIQLLIFGFIFCTTDTYVFHGNAPLLEVAMAFLLAGVVCYFAWAKKSGFWPYAWEEFTSDEEGLDHMVVYVADDGFDDEFSVLKKRLAQREDEISRLKTLGTSSVDVMSERNADIDNAQKALGQKEYKIIQLTRKLEDQRRKYDELSMTLSDKSKELDDAKMKQEEMRRKLESLKMQYGVSDDNSDYVPSDSERGRDADVLNWGVDEVIDWWRRTLPRGAQQFIPVVEECCLTGGDLVELDGQMLEQLKIRKLLVRKILKQIEPLREQAGLPVRQLFDDYSESRQSGGSKSLTRQSNMPRSHSRGDAESEYTGQSWWNGQQGPQRRTNEANIV